MSGEGLGEVWRRSPYRGATLLVHLAIGDVVNDAHANEFWMAVKDLAKKARVSGSTARAALETLVADGYLTRLTPEDRPGVPVKYRFEFSTHSRSPAMSDATTHSRSPASHSRSPATHSYIANETERKKRDASVAEAECPAEGRELIERFCSLLDGNEVRYSVGSTWFDAMRLMLVKDNRKAAEVAAVMDWAASDGFWRANVLSIPTLREKFDKLRLSMKRTSKSRDTVPSEDEIVAAMRRDRGDR